MAEFTRDQPQPGYIQYLPLIVFVILIIIQIIYFIFAMASNNCQGGNYRQGGNGTAMVVGLIIAIIILIILIWVIYVLCQQGWNLSAWFIVIVILILSVLFGCSRNNRSYEEVNLNIVQ